MLAAYPLTSLLFGSEGISTITVPTLILAGSQDIIAPTVPEQIYPFLWLTTPHKYLGLMVPGTHFSTSDVRYSGQYPAAIRGPNTAIGQDYLRSLSVAFFQTYLNNDHSYSPYLTSSYTQSISQDAMRLHLVQSLTAEQLQAAYGAPVPLSIEPEPIATTPPSSSPAILTEIAETGALKAAKQLPSANYALFPQEPLTCDAYGLILPTDDRAWRNQISAFLNSEKGSQIRDQWLTASVPEEVSTLEYCLDRQDEF